MSFTSKSFKFIWKLKNFSFCNFYTGERLYSPVFNVNEPFKSSWFLYMFPNGTGSEKYVGIYIQRHEDSGPKEISAHFKISLLNSSGAECLEHGCLDDENPMNIFEKGSEWGYNDFIKRTDIKKGSEYLISDTLTVHCQFVIKKPNESDKRPNSEAFFRDTKGIEKLCNAMKSIYENHTYSDISFMSGNKVFTANKCILKVRLPELFNILSRTPDKTFTNCLTTEKILLYAYTGKLDLQDFDCLDAINALDEYGLSSTKQRMQVQPNVHKAKTYFYIKKQTFSWKIKPSVLINETKLISPLITDDSGGIAFVLSLSKPDEEFWEIFIKVMSDDDIFARCKISVRNYSDFHSEFEHFFKRNESWKSPTTINILQNLLIFDYFGVPLLNENEPLILDFMITYPTGKISNTIKQVNCASDSCYIIDDSIQLSMDLEELYCKGYEADITVEAGHKTFKAHKCILSSRSPVFRAMLEHDTFERNENKIVMKSRESDLDDNLYSAVVDKFLLFVYSGKFDAPTKEIEEHLIEAIDMYMIGEDYTALA